METLLQMITYDEITEALQIFDKAYIKDKPSYEYRGLMIDTTEHFLPVKSLKLILDGMAANKLNHLHWHFADHDHFTLKSEAFSDVSHYGASGKHQLYTKNHIKDLVSYATIRGVQIFPEIISPLNIPLEWLGVELDPQMLKFRDVCTLNCPKPFCNQVELYKRHCVQLFALLK